MSDDYAGVMPELANLLRNSVTTGNTFVEKEAKIQALFNDVAGFSTTSRDFLEQNGENIIRLGEVSQAQLPLFAEYSPQYPCLLEGMADWIPRMKSALARTTPCTSTSRRSSGSRRLRHRRRPGVRREQRPALRDAPEPAATPRANPGPQPRMSELDDGVDYPHVKFRRRPAPALDLTSGFAGTAAERSVVAALAAPVMGVRHR